MVVVVVAAAVALVVVAVVATPTPIMGPCYNLEASVTRGEVKIALRGFKDATPVLDGMKRVNLDEMKFIDCAVHMTLWLFSGLPPSP